MCTTHGCEGERPTSPRLTKPTPPSPPLSPPRAPPAPSVPHGQPRLAPCTLTPPQATLVPCLLAASPGCPLFAVPPPLCCPPQANSFVCSLLLFNNPPCFAPVPLAPACLAHTCGQPLPAPCSPSLSACSAPGCASIRMHPTALILMFTTKMKYNVNSGRQCKHPSASHGGGAAVPLATSLAWLGAVAAA